MERSAREKLVNSDANFVKNADTA
ncbi:MAG: hypothetical protein QOD93_2423, partial [Acetobacteraceae bacterium]|nr:hypothetical protein [Acetobacteraceae bacterium]